MFGFFKKTSYDSRFHKCLHMLSEDMSLLQLASKVCSMPLLQILTMKRKGACSYFCSQQWISSLHHGAVFIEFVIYRIVTWRAHRISCLTCFRSTVDISPTSLLYFFTMTLLFWLLHLMVFPSPSFQVQYRRTVLFKIKVIPSPSSPCGQKTCKRRVSFLVLTV